MAMISEKQVEITRATYRIMHETPGHVTYGFWINGGKTGELTVRQSERAGFTIMMFRAGFKHTTLEEPA